MMNFVKGFLDKIVIVFFILMSTSFFFNNHVAKAKYNIKWKTTNVVLEYRKCIVKGYFYNSWDVGGTVTGIKFIVDVKDKKGGSQLYTKVWKHYPKNCYIKAGEKKSWSFWINDESCPSWSGKNYWYVKPTVWTK